MNAIFDFKNYETGHPIYSGWWGRSYEADKKLVDYLQHALGKNT